MNTRTLGFNFCLRDGLRVDGCTPLHEPGEDATEMLLDRARVRRHLPPGGVDSHAGRVLQLDGGGWLVHAARAGAALVSQDAMTVWCAPVPDHELSWRALLTAQVMPLVATLRGHEVFHAAGVVHAGHAHLLCAASGVGKSSLAVQLVLAGAQLLSDDVVALDRELVAHPGPTLLKLRGPERENVERHHGGMPMRWMAQPGQRSALAVDRLAEARPLGGVYLLGRYRHGDPVTLIEAPQPGHLLGATFNPSVRTPERLIRQLDLCARLAAGVPVREVRITRDRPAPALAAILLEHMDEPATVRR
jgi:hypothetical protein